MKDLLAFKNEMTDEGIMYCLSGPISNDLITVMGDALKRGMELSKIKSTTIFRVFAIVVEQAQNIIRYSDETIPDHMIGEESLRVGIILVGFEKNNFFVLSGNTIKTKKVTRLKEKLEIIQSMDKVQLKQYYKEQRKKGPDETSKGAGLGFIEMARKSSEKIQFDFKKTDESRSFFSMKTIISAKG